MHSLNLELKQVTVPRATCGCLHGSLNIAAIPELLNAVPIMISQFQALTSCKTPGVARGHGGAWN